MRCAVIINMSVGRNITLILFPVEKGSTNAQSTSLTVSIAATTLFHLNNRCRFGLFLKFFLLILLDNIVAFVKCNGLCDSFIFLTHLLYDHNNAKNQDDGN